MITTHAERLEAAHKIVEGISAVDRDQLAALFSGGFIDQMRAASSDAARRMHRVADTVDDFGGVPPTPHHPTRDATATLLAIFACKPCVHIRRQGPRPSTAVLAQRRLVCDRCARTVTKPVLTDDQCDVCERCDVAEFRQVLIQHGAVVVAGDVCPACNETLITGGD